MQRLKLLQIERKIVSFNGRRFYVIKSKNFYDVLGLTASATQVRMYICFAAWSQNAKIFYCRVILNQHTSN